MKKNASPELSSKWWSSNQPDGLSAANDLDKALSAYESASAKLDKEQNEANRAAALKALDQVESAAKKVADEATKAEKSPPKKSKSEPEEYGFTADALKKMGKVTGDARKAIEAAAKAAPPKGQGDDEDDDDEGVLGNEKEYQAYLKKNMRRLNNVMLNFAVGLGKKPEDHRLLFHKAKPGRAMMATIKAETDLKKFSFGIAGAHAEKTGVLTLGLEGIQLPGLKKKLERMLKHFKPLPFNKIMMMVDGEEAEDIVDPEDTDIDDDVETTTGDAPAEPVAATPASDPAADFKARLTALAPRIAQATAAGVATAADAKLKASEAGVFARKKDFTAALALLDEAEALLAAAPSGAAAQPRSPGGDKEAALTRWRETRGDIVTKLKDIAKEVAAAKHAESKNALLELNAVIKNLTAEPDTAQKVQELIRWVEQDDVVADVSDFAEDIRSPLLDALDELRVSMAA